MFVSTLHLERINFFIGDVVQFAYIMFDDLCLGFSFVLYHFKYD